MASLPQEVQFWAHCPFCDPGIDQGVFPVQVKISCRTEFKSAVMHLTTEHDTAPIRNHMERLHPDKLLA
jgi:hypothetical protein